MPKEIVTESNRVELKGRTQTLSSKAKSGPRGIETCVAPECNLSTKDVKLFLNELKKYMKLFKPAFQRMEQIQKSLTYMNGLLGNVARKNVEQMALGHERESTESAILCGAEPVADGTCDWDPSRTARRDVGGRGRSHVDR